MCKYICIVCLFCSSGQNVPVLVQHILCTVVHAVLGRGGEEGSLSPKKEDENLSERERTRLDL